MRQAPNVQDTWVWGGGGACTKKVQFYRTSLIYGRLLFDEETGYMCVTVKAEFAKLKVSSGQQYFRVLHLVYAVISDPGSIDQKEIYCPKL
jgi:hypothetical protein